MKRILFLIHDLGSGGAEKVLVNLVNNLDREKFDISVTVLFGGGINEQFLADDIHFNAVFKKMIPANSIWMKLFTPQQLYRICVKDTYDIVISYLEGPSARIVSGCTNENTKIITWIHSTLKTKKEISQSFRSYNEAKTCYSKFDKIICVSQKMKDKFCNILNCDGRCAVLYNTIESDKIRNLAKENLERIDNRLNIISVGTLKVIKGHDRLLRVVKRLKDEKYSFCLSILGTGPLEEDLRKYIKNNELDSFVKLEGYQTNPYKYMKKADLLVCSSYSEGFSTVVTEALVLGVPVCTVDIPGMREILGENSEYGLIEENTEEGIYRGIKRFLDKPELLEQYKEKAELRGQSFRTENTIRAVEDMLLNI